MRGVQAVLLGHLCHEISASGFGVRVDDGDNFGLA